MRLYIVKAGDTLSSIAEKYGLELEQLLAINPQITNPDNIMPGMKIKIASGPVSVGPGQPEIGHPIHQTPQVQSPSVETPFMQFPIPAVEAGQSGTPLYPINGQSTGGMSGQVGSPGMTESYSTAVQGSAGTNVSVGSGGTTGSAGEHPPYLSTIPHHFAGNPLYSGLGANISAQENVSTQPSTAMTMNHSPSGFTGMSLQQPSHNMPSASLHQQNQPHVQQSYPSYPTNTSPYVQPSLPTAPGALGVWPDSAYSWSTPFEQMTTMSVATYPFSNKAPFKQTASNVPLTMHSANQMPMGLQSANQMPMGLQSANQMPMGVQSANKMPMGLQAANSMPIANMPIALQSANTMPMANAMPAMKKKPCGCGGSSVGHYSLAQKRIAEGQAQSEISGETITTTDRETADTAENEVRSIAAVEGDQEQRSNTQSVQSHDKPAAEIKQSTRRKEKNRTSKRRTQKRQRSKAHIHRSKGTTTGSARYPVTKVEDGSLSEHEDIQNVLDSRQPQSPWLNV